MNCIIDLSGSFLYHLYVFFVCFTCDKHVIADLQADLKSLMVFY